MNRQRGAVVAELGAKYYAEGKIENAREHLPNYLRKSQAERERKRNYMQIRSMLQKDLLSVAEIEKQCFQSHGLRKV